VRPVISSQYVGDRAVLALRSLTLLALRDAAVRQWLEAQPWSEQLDEMDAARLLASILHTGVCAEDGPASLAAFTAGLSQEDQALIDAMLREKLPPDPVAVAREYWRGLEKHSVERRREVLLARLRDPNLTPGEATEIQKLILDLQKRLTDISRPLSPPGSEQSSASA
jgi:DNA primase